MYPPRLAAIRLPLRRCGPLTPNRLNKRRAAYIWISRFPEQVLTTLGAQKLYATRKENMWPWVP